MSNPNPATDELAAATRRRHLRFGWWSLLVFLTLGLVLESMNGFKIGWYVDVSNETRRVMWRLAHAHGTLLALIHIAFACTAGHHGHATSRFASPCLIAASLLLPGGFLLGGATIYDGDPGPGVLLVPLGAALFFIAVFLTARRL